MFDCVCNRIRGSANKGLYLENLDKDHNSLFCKILPITACESRFCGRERQLSRDKCFYSSILGKEIKKITHIPPIGRPRESFLSAECGIKSHEGTLGMNCLVILNRGTAKRRLRVGADICTARYKQEQVPLRRCAAVRNDIGATCPQSWRMGLVPAKIDGSVDLLCP